MDPYSVVIFHDPCDDGKTGAWAYYKSLSPATQAELALLGGIFGSSAAPHMHVGPRTTPSLVSIEGALALRAGPEEAKRVLGVEIARTPPVIFVGVAPQTPIPAALVAGQRVVVIDVDLGASLMPVVEAAAETLVIDHHPSARKYIVECAARHPEKFGACFETDKSESGATLAWKHFHPGTPVPDLVDIVRVGDTWSWGGYWCDAQAVQLVMRQDKVLRNFGSITEAAEKMADRNYVLAVAEKGAQLLAYRDSIVSDIARKAEVFYVTDGARTYRGLGVNNGHFVSEVGNAIREEVAPAYEAASGTAIDFVFCWFHMPVEDKIIVSLRGPGEGIDLSVLAATVVGLGKENGGGHKPAAGFQILDLTNFWNVFSK